MRAVFSRVGRVRFKGEEREESSGISRVCVARRSLQEQRRTDQSCTTRRGGGRVAGCGGWKRAETNTRMLPRHPASCVQTGPSRVATKLARSSLSDGRSLASTVTLILLSVIPQLSISRHTRTRNCTRARRHNPALSTIRRCVPRASPSPAFVRFVVVGHVADCGWFCIT